MTAADPTQRRIFALAVLCLVYLLNFLDRTLIYILFPPIKAEMAFTDLQLALLGTTSFVLFYTLLGIPFGRLADKVSRKHMIAAGLLTWSLFSGLTGFATGFWTIFFCRVMVGVGEATLGPAAMSLLSDLFPPERRATVQSIYSAGIPLGAATALFAGGALGEAIGWRNTFFLLGFPGVALAMVVLTLPEPGRQVVVGAPPSDWRPLLKIRALRWHVVGYAFMAVAGNSLGIWIPTLLNRVHDIPLTTVGYLTGISMGVSGGLATAFGGAAADRWRATAAGGRLRFSATLAALCVPFWLLLLTSSSQPVLFASFFALAGLGLAWLGPAAADVHGLVGPQNKGIGIAMYFFVVNMLGYGVAPPVIGTISDALGGQEAPEMLQRALFICPAACVVAALVLWRAAKEVEATA
jgi:MFS family permease